MAQQIKTRVPFVLEVATNCVCGNCPVQGDSKCVASLKAGLAEAVKRTPLKHEEIPGVYCGAGTATCSDLDPNQGCICGTCQVFSQYKLETGLPAGYFCRDGVAR